MAIYDLGTASLSANGEVTGVGTTWKAPLTLIRVGATIVFKTEPVQIYTISEIISDTQVNVYNPNSETVPAGTGYAILAHDGITVQGLAQDAAETLRYYQSQETKVSSLVELAESGDFDFYKLQRLVNKAKASETNAASSASAASASQQAAATSKAQAESSASMAQNAYKNTVNVIANAGDAGTLITLANEGIASASTIAMPSLDWQQVEFKSGGNYRVLVSNMTNVPSAVAATYPTANTTLFISVRGTSGPQGSYEIDIYPSLNSDASYRATHLRMTGAKGSRNFYLREYIMVQGGGSVGGATTERARGLLDVYSKDESNDLLNYKYGYPTSSPAGALQRKIQEKLNNFAFLEDFGGKADNGDTDNGPAFVAAFAAGVTNIQLGSSGVYAIASGNIELPERFNITGKGDGCEIKYLGTDDSFTMFTLKGSKGASNWKNGGTFSDVVISSENQAMTWFLGEYIQNVNLERVVLYNSRTIVNDFHYMNFNTCRLIASGFNGRANLPGSKVSEAPKFIGCFASNSPIDIKDTADLAIIGSTMFAGEYIVKTGTERDNITQPDLRKGFPVLFSNSVFDAGKGSAWRLENVAYASISGCFVSCGRTYNSDGAYLDKVYDTSISNCTFTYCGRFGLAVERSNKISIVGCNFNGNKKGGLALIDSENINVVGGNAGNSYIQGGYYIQPVGITSPADNCKNVVVTGFNFGPELATKYYFGTDASRGNRVVSCTGVLDSVFRGGPSDRPSGASYGQQFFDTSLGQPIWWNSVSSTWKNALGEDV